MLETQHYQPAFIDVPILIQKSEAYQVLMHFEDPENVLKNDGAINFTSATETFSSSSDQKHFGDYSAYCYNYSLNSSDTLYLGGQDFTVDFWAYVTNTGVGFDTGRSEAVELLGIYSDSGDAGTFLTINPQSGRFWCNGSATSATYTGYAKNQWNHYAACYNHEQAKLTVYFNGVAIGNYTGTIERKAVTISSMRTYHYLDELRILNGICAWNEDFTPPTQPY